MERRRSGGHLRQARSIRRWPAGRLRRERGGLLPPPIHSLRNPIDNIGAPVMNVLAQITHSDFWLNITAYFLGPLLNRLPGMLLPAEARSGFEAFGSEPLVAVSGSQALWVIGAYSFVFVVVALVSTWKRDVKE